MNYCDGIKNLQELNGTHEQLRSAIGELRAFEKSLPIRFPALECIAEQQAKLAEIVRPLKEITLFQDNNISKLIKEISPIFSNMQSLLPKPQSLDVLNNTYFSEVINSIATIHSPIDNIINSLVQTGMLEKTFWEFEQAAGGESATSSEEIAEFRDDLQDMVADSRNWQQKIADKKNKWKEDNPVIYDFIDKIILVIALALFSNSISAVMPNAMSAIFEKTNTTKAVVKEEPNASGNVIYNITINQEVKIIDDTRYYYKVVFYSDGSDEPIIGWISKRSVEINDNPSDLQYIIPVILDSEPTEPVDTYINSQTQTPT